VASPAHLRRTDGSHRRVEALAPLLSHDWPVAVANDDLRTTIRYALVDERRARYRLLLGEVFAEDIRDVPLRAAWVLRRRVRRTWTQLRRRSDKSVGGEEFGN
jgi:hypothetical protein